MRIVGITGPTGAGKSSLSSVLRKNGIPVIDADELYHSLLVPPSACLDALRKAFGDGVFVGEELNRHALSKIVFSDAEKLSLLNSTVLGFVLSAARKIFADYARDGISVAAFDAPTLIESGFCDECDLVISVLSSPEARIERIVARDGLSLIEAEARVRAQKDDRFYIERSDIVLRNDGDEGELVSKCEELSARILGGSL